MRTNRAILRVGFTAAILSVVLIGAACGGGGGGGGVTSGGAGTAPFAIQFAVTNTASMPVSGARVYLVPAADVDSRFFDAAEIRAGTSEDYDEPLEDAIRLKGSGYAQGTTDGAGMATVANVPDGRFFWFVAPAGGDAEHLPGGSGCRTSWDAVTLAAQTNAIEMSSQPSGAATHVGTTTCLVCHSSHSDYSKHAMRLGFAVPGALTSLQDTSRYPEFEDGWDKFLPANDYTTGTVVWFSDRDGTRGFDDFITTTVDPTIANGAAVTYVKAYLWKDNADSKYKITLQNVHPQAGSPTVNDPPNLWTLNVDLTYGGAVYKQRNLVSIPGRKGRYPLLQIQTQGDDARFDRTRKTFRDYHLDWYWNDTAKTFQYPATSKAFEGNCTACHSTGFERYQDGTTGENLSRAVHDVNGAFDLDNDGTKDEINTGCEVCHGPGSDHISWVTGPNSTGMKARYIVRPDNLSPSREMMICGRCHDRVAGNGTTINDEPLNQQNEMPRVGIGRMEYLADYTTRKGPKSSSMWSDETHSKSHHQQYSDMLKSNKHRNDRLLVTCASCHGSHGEAPFEHHLRYDPENSGPGGLCAQCHNKDINQHMLAKTGSTHKASLTQCIDCHAPQVAKTGSGSYGNLITPPPTGGAADADTAYFRNDITSHLFRAIPKKTHPDVAGAQPIKAMPIPYTNSCGQPCHVTVGLPFLSPIFAPLKEK